MIGLNRREVLAACTGLLIVAASPAFAELKSPGGVRTALRIMDQVVNHTGRLIAAKNYDQVPREFNEFSQGVTVLRGAIEDEPAAFKAKVGPLVDRAVASSVNLNETSKSHDDAKLAAAHAAFAASVKAVLAQFPKDVQPPTAPARPAG